MPSDFFLYHLFMFTPLLSMSQCFLWWKNLLHVYLCFVFVSLANFSQCGREFSYCLQNGFEINIFVYMDLTRIVFVVVSLFGPFPHYFRHLQTKLQSGKSLPVPINDIMWVLEYMCNVDKDTLLHRARQQNAHWNFRWTFCCLKMHFANHFKAVAYQILSSSL